MYLWLRCVSNVSVAPNAEGWYVITMTDNENRSSSFTMPPLNGSERPLSFKEDKILYSLIDSLKVENRTLTEENTQMRNLLQIILHELGPFKVTNRAVQEFSTNNILQTQADARDNSITISVREPV